MRPTLTASRLVLIAALAGSAGLAVPAPAQSPYWLAFEGSGFLEAPHSAGLNTTEGLTIEAWVFVPSDMTWPGEGCVSLVGKDWITAYWLGLCNGVVRFYPAGIASFVDGITPIPRDRWVHVAGTCDGDTTRVWVDRSVDSEQPGPGLPLSTSTAPLRIGSDVSWEFSPVGALVDGVRIWSTALDETALRLSSLYESPPSAGGLPVGKLAFALSSSSIRLGTAEAELETQELSFSGDAFLSNGLPGCRFERLVPAAAHAAGAAGSQWRTDLSLYPATVTPANFTLTFIPRDDPGAAQTETMELQPGPTLLQDVVLSVFGQSSASGALRICADRYFEATSRTYNQAGEDATFGQSIPALSRDELSAQPTSYFLGPMITGLFQNDRFRTNLGIFNPGPAPLELSITLIDGNGTSLVSTDLSVDPWELTQIDRIFATLAGTDVSNGSISLVVTSPGSSHPIVWASVVDNTTSDGTLYVRIPVMPF